MMYRHSARFQIVLRDALRMQSIEVLAVPGKDPIPYSDEQLLRVIGYSKERTTLTKFRNARLPAFGDPKIAHMSANGLKGGLRDEGLATALWEYLSANDYIRRALSAGKIKRVNRKELFSERQVANTIAAFFDTHESQIRKYSEQGIVEEIGDVFEDGEWVCFKNSWRQPGFIVKSRFRFTNEHGEYFSVSDEQKSTGRFSSIGHEVAETSTGIAVSKSEKLWCFMRESEREQPRIFCFFRRLITVEALDTSGAGRGRERLSVLYGHVMETERSIKGEFYATFVVLISKTLDKKEWESVFKKPNQYNFDDQIDVFPGPKLNHEMDRQPQKKYKIPDFVLDYLETGIAKP